MMIMQHVSTYNSHLQAKLRTVIALQGGCVHLGSHMAYSVFAAVSIHNVIYLLCYCKLYSDTSANE
jgi:hypothetical protein